MLRIWEAARISHNEKMACFRLTEGFWIEPRKASLGGLYGLTYIDLSKLHCSKVGLVIVNTSVFLAFPHPS